METEVSKLALKCDLSIRVSILQPCAWGVQPTPQEKSCYFGPVENVAKRKKIHCSPWCHKPLMVQDYPCHKTQNFVRRWCEPEAGNFLLTRWQNSHFPFIGKFKIPSITTKIDAVWVAMGYILFINCNSVSKIKKR